MTNTNRAGTRSILFYLLPFLLLSAGVHSLDKQPTADYGPYGNNITGVNNGPVYNTTELKDIGLNGYTFDGSNDYLTVTPAPGVNGLCNFGSTTSWTVALRINLPSTNSGSGNTIFKWCHMDSTPGGNGYLFKLNAPTNQMGIQNGSTTIQGVNSSVLLTRNQPALFFYTFYGNGTVVMMHNMTTTFNGSMAGVAANNSSTDNTTIGAQNGGAQRFSGTVYEIIVYKRALSYAEIENITNGSQGGIMPIDTLNLSAYYPFRNQTTANASVDTTDFNRNIPVNPVGFHGQPSFISSFGQITVPGGVSLGTTRKYLYDQALMTLAGATYNRIPAHGGNVVSAVNVISSTNLTLTYRRDTGVGVQERNVDHWIQNVNYSNSTGGYLNIVFDETPDALANNSSPLCSYGVTASNRNSCMPYNFTLYTQYIARFIVDIGCFNYTNPVCVVNPSRNEPYNPGSTHFWLDNATCVQRTQNLIALWNYSGRQAVNDTLAAWGYNTSKIVYYAGPSFADFASSGDQCSEAMETNFTAAFPYGGNNSPQYQEAHIYCYDAETCDLPTQMSQWQSRMTNSSYTCNYGFTEGGVEDDYDNQNASMYVKALTEEANIYMYAETCAQFNSQFQSTYYDTATTGQSPSWFNAQFANASTQVFNRTYGKFDALRNAQLIPELSGVYDCNVNNTAIPCLYTKVNSTRAYVYLVNKQSHQADLSEVNISGFTTTSAIRMTQGRSVFINSTETVTAGKLDPSPIFPYGSAVFMLTGTSDPITLSQQPSYLVNITEPNSQNFNITITNPGNQSYNVNWTMNGSNVASCYNLTTCTFTGGYTTAGQYNITATVFGDTNTVNVTWLLQINNTVQNVSATYNPSGSSATISGSQSQTFSYTLSNPDNFSATTTWRLNGVNQTTCFNATSCQFSGTTLGLGSFNVNVTTVATSNTISKAWTLTVQEGCQDMAGGTAMRAFMFILPLIFFAFMWLVFSTMDMSPPVVLVLTLSIIAFIGVYPSLLAMVCIL